MEKLVLILISKVALQLPDKVLPKHCTVQQSLKLMKLNLHCRPGNNFWMLIILLLDVLRQFSFLYNNGYNIVMIVIVGGDNVRKYWPHYFAGAQGIVRNTLYMYLCLLIYQEFY